MTPVPPRPLSAIVLAAGEGRRMRSTVPKPLHRLCGRPMVLHVLDALAELPIERVVIVVGYHSIDVVQDPSPKRHPSDLRLEFVEQALPRGTGDAVAVGLTAFPDEEIFGDGDLVVLPGDTPLLRPATLAALVREHREADAAATLAHRAPLVDPTGYGRVVRIQGRGRRPDRRGGGCIGDEQAIDEVNTSIYCFRQSLLAPSLRRLRPNNAKGEYYLTDAIEVLDSAGYAVTSMIGPIPPRPPASTTVPSSPLRKRNFVTGSTNDGCAEA